MELIIDKNGKAVDIEDVSVTIVYESKEEADRVKEAMTEGRVQQMEWTEVLWEPVENDNGEDIIRFLSKMPEDGEEVIMTDGKNIWTDIWEDAWGFESTDVPLRESRLFWMPIPEPYKPKEEEGTT